MPTGPWLLKTDAHKVILLFEGGGVCYIIYLPLEDDGSQSPSVKKEDWYFRGEDWLILQDYMGEFQPLRIVSHEILEIPNAFGPWEGQFERLSQESLMILLDPYPEVKDEMGDSSQ